MVLKNGIKKKHVQGTSDTKVKAEKKESVMVRNVNIEKCKNNISKKRGEGKLNY